MDGIKDPLLINENTLTKTTVFSKEGDLIVVQKKPLKDLKRLGTLVSVNDRYSKYETEEEEIMVITHAEKDDITKYMKKKRTISRESPQDYRCIRDLVYNQDITWIYNILDSISEQEKIIYSNDMFVLLPDIKWDCEDMEKLYYLVIVRDRSLKSIRDITRKDIPLLKSIKTECLKCISEKHDITEDTLRVYLHYRPSFWHLHIHINVLTFYGYSISVDRSIMLDDVIQNVEMRDDYYQKATLTYVK
jgi:m7GpppX diphosphatase